MSKGSQILGLKAKAQCLSFFLFPKSKTTSTPLPKNFGIWMGMKEVWKSNTVKHITLKILPIISYDSCSVYPIKFKNRDKASASGLHSLPFILPAKALSKCKGQFRLQGKSGLYLWHEPWIVRHNFRVRSSPDFYKFYAFKNLINTKRGKNAKIPASLIHWTLKVFSTM